MSQINSKIFTFDSYPNANTARYAGPSNSASLRDIIDLTRTPVSPSATQVKSTARRVIGIVNADTGETGEITVRQETSHPKWATQAQVQDAIDDAKGLAADQAWSDLVWKHDLNADFESV